MKEPYIIETPVAPQIVGKPAAIINHAAVASNCTPTVEIYIDGDYNGWYSGQWSGLEQGIYHYNHYAYHPNVVIYPTTSGHHIRDVGDDG